MHLGADQDDETGASASQIVSVAPPAPLLNTSLARGTLESGVVMTNFTRPDAIDILDDFNFSPERRLIVDVRLCVRARNDGDIDN
jgi:hypothetical protein